MANLLLYIVTFNCGRALIEPEAFGQHLLDGWQNPIANGSKTPDLIVLNLQEIAPLSYAFLSNNLVNPYFDRFRQAVRTATAGSDYVNIVSRHCGLTALMIFAREDVASEIRSLRIGEVGVGVSEMGNKGAIGARIGWKLPDAEGSMYTTFVSAHLAPFEEEIDKRRQDYRHIARGLVFSTRDANERVKEQSNAEDVPLLMAEVASEEDEAKPVGIYADDTYLFFSGDLNYRTALTSPGRNDYEEYPIPTKNIESARHYRHLLEKDQLTQQLEQGKTLHGLTEQAISFPPTYKYKLSKEKPVLLDEENSEWDWAQHRWPSWCDRILFSSTSVLEVQAGKYSALPLFRTSDHRPVALSAAVPLRPIKDSRFSEQAPVSLEASYQSRRDAARRKEIVVGLGAYLSLTWEGNTLVFGTICFLLGAIYLWKSIP